MHVDVRHTGQSAAARPLSDGDALRAEQSGPATTRPGKLPSALRDDQQLCAPASNTTNGPHRVMRTVAL
jgi:hypothetical protein